MSCTNKVLFLSFGSFSFPNQNTRHTIKNAKKQRKEFFFSMLEVSQRKSFVCFHPKGFRYKNKARDTMENSSLLSTARNSWNLSKAKKYYSTNLKWHQSSSSLLLWLCLALSLFPDTLWIIMWEKWLESQKCKSSKWNRKFATVLKVFKKSKMKRKNQKIQVSSVFF